jgi:hypothetical protein
MMNNLLKKKKILASLWVGVLGAFLGVFEGFAGTLEGIDNGRGGYYAHFTLPAAIMSGFLVCFFLSLIYLRFIRQSRIRWGALFGAFAGAFSGLIMGSALMFARVHDLWWAILGAVSGAVVGLIMTLIGRSFLDKLTN